MATTADPELHTVPISQPANPSAASNAESKSVPPVSQQPQNSGIKGHFEDAVHKAFAPAAHPFPHPQLNVYLRYYTVALVFVALVFAAMSFSFSGKMVNINSRTTNWSSSQIPTTGGEQFQVVWQGLGALAFIAIAIYLVFFWKPTSNLQRVFVYGVVLAMMFQWCNIMVQLAAVWGGWTTWYHFYISNDAPGALTGYVVLASIYFITLVAGVVLLLYAGYSSRDAFADAPIVAPPKYGEVHDMHDINIAATQPGTVNSSRSGSVSEPHTQMQQIQSQPAGSWSTASSSMAPAAVAPSASSSQAPADLPVR